MMNLKKLGYGLLILLVASCAPQKEEAKEETAEFKVPVDYYTLDVSLRPQAS